MAYSLFDDEQLVKRIFGYECVGELNGHNGYLLPPSVHSGPKLNDSKFKYSFRDGP